MVGLESEALALAVLVVVEVGQGPEVGLVGQVGLVRLHRHPRLDWLRTCRGRLLYPQSAGNCVTAASTKCPI